MYSFKPNINLLRMISIVISYMISSGDNLANTDYNYCRIQLTTDNFDIYQISGTQHMILAEYPIEAFKTPYGKVYQKILNVHKANIYPNEFCLWIHDDWVYPHGDLSVILRESKQDLKTYIYIDFCLWDLNQDGFNINLDNNMEYNIQHAHESIGRCNSSHGKAYDIFINNYKANINAIEFCLWINEDAYKDHIVMWRHLIQDLTINEFINCFPNLHENLCLYDIRINGFIIDVVNDNLANLGLAQQSTERFTTPHGSAYQAILVVYATNMDPKYFCFWLYGNFDHDNVWLFLKGEIAYNTCIDQLNYDGFFVESNESRSCLRHVRRQGTWFKTWHAKKYGDVLLGKEPTISSSQIPKMYCEYYRRTHQAYINPQN